jgi:hypothetical protein
MQVINDLSAGIDSVPPCRYRKTRRLPSTRERYSRRARATGKQIHREASVPVARSEDQRTYKAGLTGVLLLRNYLTVQRVSQRRARLDTVSLRKDVTRLTGEGCERNKCKGHCSELVERGFPFPSLTCTNQRCRDS